MMSTHATRPALSEEVRTAINQILDYLWADEERSFEEAPDDKHIFHALTILRAWRSQAEASSTKFDPGPLYITVGAWEELPLGEVLKAVGRHV